MVYFIIVTIIVETTTTVGPTKPTIPQYHFDLTAVSTNVTTLTSNNVDMNLVGTPSIDTSKNSTCSLQISNSKQYLDLGIHKNLCFGNIGLCFQGLTIQIIVKFNQLDEGTVVLSSGGSNLLGTGMAIIYQFGRLQFAVSNSNYSWFTSVGRDKIPLNIYLKLIFSWSPKEGIQVVIDNHVVAASTTSILHPTVSTTNEHLYVGNLPSSTTSSVNLCIQSVIIYHAWIGDCVAGGIIPPPSKSVKYFTFET